MRKLLVYLSLKNILPARSGVLRKPRILPLLAVFAPVAGKLYLLGGNYAE